MPRPRLEKNKTLPFGLRSRRGYYSYINSADGREHGLGRDLDTATKFADAMNDLKALPIEILSGHTERPLTRVDFKKLIGPMHSAVRARANKAGHAMMARDEFSMLWNRSKGRCEYTGIRFSGKRVDGCVKRPWMPSVDRIKCSQGYTFDNCRLVCVSVNLALNEFGDEVLAVIARGMLIRGLLGFTV